MKLKELRTLPSKELDDKLTQLKIELIKNNAQKSTGTNTKGSGSIRQKKKMIARILTIKKELSKKETKKPESTQ